MLAGCVAYMLQVDDFGNFVLGGQGVGFGPDADDGGEVTDTAVEFGEQGGGDGRVGGWVDEDGFDLPGFGGEVDPYKQHDLLGKGLFVVKMACDFMDDHYLLTRLFFDLDLLFCSERMCKVYNYHDSQGSRQRFSHPSAVNPLAVITYFTLRGIHQLL